MAQALETRTAHFSTDRAYRYWLKIVWDESLPLLCVVGLNPSTADEVKDDPTLRRVKGFARSYGLGGVLMLNAFAYRSTDPAGLIPLGDPCGPENTIDNFLKWIKEFNVGMTVAAWGSNITKKPLRYRLEELNAVGWLCFRKTKTGLPEHPLYLPKDLKPVPWNY